MTGEGKPLRWKEHSLFPYTCKGCGTKHLKGDGVYLDQSGLRTVTYDTPQCSQQEAPAEKVSKTPVVSRQPQPTPDRPHQVTLTVDLQGGRSVEVVLRVHGDGVAKPIVERLVADVSRVVMEDFS